PSGHAAPKLDMKNVPQEIRMYLGNKMRLLAAENSDAYADDPRTIDNQIDDLINHINSESRIRHKRETSTIESPGSTPYIPQNPFDYKELKASVERRGGAISGALSAEELRSQLSDEQWSKITNIDPDL